MTPRRSANGAKLKGPEWKTNFDLPRTSGDYMKIAFGFRELRP